MARVAEAGAGVRARGLGLVEVRIADVETVETGFGLGERTGGVAKLRERFPPQPDLSAAVRRVAVRTVDQRRHIVRDGHEGVESYGVADRPGRDDGNGDTERDRDARDPLA